MTASITRSWLIGLVCLVVIGTAVAPSVAGKPTDGDGNYIGNGYPSGPLSGRCYWNPYSARLTGCEIPPG